MSATDTLPQINLSRGVRALAFVAVVVIAVLIYNARIRREMVDFTVFHNAASRAVRAEPLYQDADGHYLFKYFPAFALLMAPFGLVDQNTAKFLWFLTSVGLLGMLVRWSISALPERRVSTAVLVTITIVLMAKFYARELLLGQVNVLLGAVLLAALVAAQRGRTGAAGGLTGLAIFVKPYALILLPWLVVTHGIRAATVAAIVLVAGILAPAAIYGWQGNIDLLRDWFRTVRESTTPNLLNNDNISLPAMWAKWLGPGDLASTLALLTIGATLLVAYATWRKRRAIARPDYLECALLMLLIPLVSPQGWDYVLLLATPAVVCVIDRWRDLSRRWQLTMAVALAVMGLTMFDIMGRTLYAQFMTLSIVTVCALALALGLWRLRQLGVA